MFSAHYRWMLANCKASWPITLQHRLIEIIGQKTKWRRWLTLASDFRGWHSDFTNDIEKLEHPQRCRCSECGSSYFQTGKSYFYLLNLVLIIHFLVWFVSCCVLAYQRRPWTCFCCFSLSESVFGGTSSVEEFQCVDMFAPKQASRNKFFSAGTLMVCSWLIFFCKYTVLMLSLW